jgi:hypothetical protein
MKVDHLPIIHLIDVIPGEDEDKIGFLLLQSIDILKNGISRSLIPVLVNSLLSRNDLDEFSQGVLKNVPPHLDVAMKGD